MTARMMPRPHCAACWGDGYVYGIFTGEREYCDACDGTGYDLWEPHTVAKYETKKETNDETKH